MKSVSPSKKKLLGSKKSNTNTAVSKKHNQLLVNATSPKKSNPKNLVPKSSLPAESFTIVAIGASAGGLESITQLLNHLSPTTGMAYIYVQHLSPDHKSILPSLLAKTTKMTVQEIDDMEKIKPDNVYIIPYNKGIEVVDGHIKLLPRTKGFTLSIDILFTSLAETHKSNVIGVVLSGSGSDGTEGLKRIKLEGGITFAQNNTAKFNAMPKSAINGGVVDFVLSSAEIAKKLNWISKHPFIKRKALKKITPEDDIENNNPYLKAILQQLNKRKTVDFSFYKMNTIKRRILRRMLLHKILTLKKYSEFTATNEAELTLLYQDLLINVTEFFRDGDAFQSLKKYIFPGLLKSKNQGETLRIWVAACASGEEVYSIAMILLEIQDNKNQNIPFQIFASDLSAEAISIARNGEYTLQQLKNVSPKRIQRFFSRVKDKYRISKSLRDVCIFAEHNILRDPPFSRMDFISCRNLLIYLDPAAQKKAISTFHYALNPNGCLLLGKSETIGSSSLLFSLPLSKKFKIYTRKKQSGSELFAAITPRILHTSQRQKTSTLISLPKKQLLPATSSLSSGFDAYLLAQHCPASVVINHELEILQFRGETELYLKNSSGKASLNILKMAPIEITFELRNAIHQAIKTKQSVQKLGIEMNRDKSGKVVRLVSIEVTPLKIEGDEELLVIVFTGQNISEHATGKNEAGKNAGYAALVNTAKDRRIKKLEEEITAARLDMISITQDQEAANEELQSANEEIVSSNEELQSLNEELETSKEEIESTNEELITTNQELQSRMQQVEELYTYYETILSTIHEPMLVLDKDMCIKSANNSFCKLFKVSEEESIGISLYKLQNNQWNIGSLRKLLEEIVPKNKRFQDYEVKLKLPELGSKILLLNAHRIDLSTKKEELIVLTIVDITDVRNLAETVQLKDQKVLEVALEIEKRALKKIEESEKRYSLMLMQSPFAFAVVKGKKRIITVANDKVKEIWGKGKNIEGKPLLEVVKELKNSAFINYLDKVYTTGIPHHGVESQHPHNGKVKKEERYFNYVYQPYLEADETISGVTIIAYEVTAEMKLKKALELQRNSEKKALLTSEINNRELSAAKKNAEQKTQLAEEAVKAKQQFLSNMSHEIRTPMNAIIGFTKVVLKTELSEKQKEYLNAIKLSGDALIVLINDILDLAKVEAGKMTFEHTAFQLEASITAMLHLFETKIQEKNLQLITLYDKRIPAQVIGDSVRLHQIILNLVSNAVKFTTFGKITVRISLVKEEKDKLIIEFSVEDTGIGIASNKLTSIFENFQQASSGTSRLYGGTGLGLAIVKQLVEPQGGQIKVKSKLGIGTTFSFTLPFNKVTISAEPLATVSETDTQTKNIKILVVEDIALNQLLMKTLLDDFGFENEMASNGKIAIEKLQEKFYDIILMDLQMPEMNGFEATEFIRTKLNLQIPIIALTADVTTVDLEKCTAVGMNDYLAKPIDERLLYSKIIKLVKKIDSSIKVKDSKIENRSSTQKKITDLSYLRIRTKENPKMLIEMIQAYLGQTPHLLETIRKSMLSKDWESMRAAAHKLIPSFSIVGMHKKYEYMARSIQDYAATGQGTEKLSSVTIQLEKACLLAIEELKLTLHEASI